METPIGPRNQIEVNKTFEDIMLANFNYPEFKALLGEFAGGEETLSTVNDPRPLPECSYQKRRLRRIQRDEGRTNHQEKIGRRHIALAAVLGTLAVALIASENKLLELKTQVSKDNTLQDQPIEVVRSQEARSQHLYNLYTNGD